MHNLSSLVGHFSRLRGIRHVSWVAFFSNTMGNFCLLVWEFEKKNLKGLPHLWYGLNARTALHDLMPILKSLVVQRWQNYILLARQNWARVDNYMQVLLSDIKLLRANIECFARSAQMSSSAQFSLTSASENKEHRSTWTLSWMSRMSIVPLITSMLLHNSVPDHRRNDIHD